MCDRVIEITRNKSNKHILKPINDTLLEYFNSIPEEKRTGFWDFHNLKHTVGIRLALKMYLYR